MQQLRQLELGQPCQLVQQPELVPGRRWPEWPEHQHLKARVCPLVALHSHIIAQ